MNCEILTGSIILIEYIKKEYVERIIANLQTNSITSIALVGGNTWQTLDFIPETADMQLAVVNSIAMQFNYTVKCDIGGISQANNLLINKLIYGKYLVKLSDTNGNTWLLGNHKNAGKFALGSGKIGESLPDDNSNTLIYTFRDRNPIQRII